MKLEWGQKIACPACAIPFYDFRKTSLICPNCGNSFESSELKAKKNTRTAMDEIDIEDKITEISGFEFVEDESINFAEETDSIDVSEEIEDIQLVDEQ